MRRFEALLAFSAVVALSAETAIATESARACPAVVTAGSLKPLPAGRREDLRLFTLGSAGGQPVWHSQAVQADPLDDKGILVTGTDAKADGEPISASDRIAMRIERFGQRYEAGIPFPCKSERLFEVQDARSSSRFAYLAACDDPSGATKTKASHPVRHDESKQQMGSSVFNYAYQPNNQLVFRSLTATDPVTGKVYDAGGDADLLLRLDPKRFMTIELTNKNVNSFVEASRSGNVGLVSRIQFYLKLLFFKIDLKMGTMASFFEDAANLPMLLDVPVNAFERLNPGSGMVFHWQPKDAVILVDDPGTTAPTANTALIKQGWEALAEQGASRCSSDPCVFRLAGRLSADQPFTVEMVVPRDLVSRGYYPQWIPNMARFKKDMGWDSDDDDQKAMATRAGFYFDVAGLQKGQYKMDYWIRLADWKGSTCPAPVALKRVLTPEAAPALAH
jgi:hypothetical protein